MALVDGALDTLKDALGWIALIGGAATFADWLAVKYRENRSTIANRASRRAEVIRLRGRAFIHSWVGAAIIGAITSIAYAVVAVLNAGLWAHALPVGGIDRASFFVATMVSFLLAVMFLHGLCATILATAGLILRSGRFSHMDTREPMWSVIVKIASFLSASALGVAMLAEHFVKHRYLGIAIAVSLSIGVFCGIVGSRYVDAGSGQSGPHHES